MKRRAKKSSLIPQRAPIAAAFWLVPACLLLGGASNGGALANLLLQMMAAAVLAAAIWRGQTAIRSKQEKALGWFLGLLVLWIGLTLVPLPPVVWESLPGRKFVADGYRLLELELPWLPISLTDDRTVRSALALLIPVATYLAVRKLDEPARVRLAAVVAAIAVASVGLGIAQLVTGPSSALRFYSVTNRDDPVGFFANANHFATLLLVTMPLAMIGLQDRYAKVKRGKPAPQWQWVPMAAVALLVTGIVLIGSNAGLLLAVPALGGALLLGPLRAWLAKPIVTRGLGVVALAAVAALAVTTSTGFLQEKVGVSASSRAVITQNTLSAASDYLPVGSGLGSFSAIYLKESGGEKSAREWMNHAHNDYAEVALELGLPGVALAVAFAIWLVIAAAQSWFSTESDLGARLRRAASLGVILILAHSFVDYPLRSAAMAGVFGMLLALLMPQPVRTENGADE